MTVQENRLWKALSQIPGGYEYWGAASVQLCFPLKAGGELRFMQSDAGPDHIFIDLYGGELPPGINGPAFKTGRKNHVPLAGRESGKTPRKH